MKQITLKGWNFHYFSIIYKSFKSILIENLPLAQPVSTLPRYTTRNVGSYSLILADRFFQNFVALGNLGMVGKPKLVIFFLTEFCKTKKGSNQELSKLVSWVGKRETFLDSLVSIVMDNLSIPCSKLN